MTRQEMVDFIIEYYNEHFKFQKLVYDMYIDRDLVEQLSDKELEKFIDENCK